MSVANVRIQHKRGNTTVSSTYTGPIGEITVDTTTYQLRVHDGATAGGYVIPRASGELGNVTAGSIRLSRTLTGTSGSNATVRATATLGADYGSSTSTSPASGYGTLGIVSGSSLTRTSNYLAGVVGAYNITGTNASTFPKAGVVGFIADTTTTADAAVMAYLDGDGGITSAGAGFGITMQNTTAGSGFDYGMDLNMVSIGAGYVKPYKKAEWRVSNDIVFLTGAGVPTNGTTGADFAGPGSLCIDITNAKLYINGGTKASPVWKLVTSAA